MIGVDLIGQIRRAYFEQHRSIKEIVRTLSVSRATVRKIMRGKFSPRPSSVWVDVLTEILERRPTARSGSAVQLSGCSKNCVGADMTARPYFQKN